MAQRTPTQLARRRRVESLIRVVAPTLDLLLAAGEQLSRVAGRNDVDPEPPRRLDPSQRAARLASRADRR
jgi:hypothetical protein